MPSLFRRFVNANVALSGWADNKLPAKWRVDGNSDFMKDFVWKYLRPRQKVYDVGGGKQPFLGAEKKRALECVVVGIDISEQELSKAPTGAYDRTIQADICTFRGDADADVVICQTLLEHVSDVEAAMGAIATILKPGGLILLFVPCRNALFAKLNLLLPESFKHWLLYTLFPASRHGQGFKAYYDRCTPKQLSVLAETCGLKVLELRRYYVTAYFWVFFPAYLVWRFWTMIVLTLRLENSCEGFSAAFTKNPVPVTNDLAKQEVGMA